MLSGFDLEEHEEQMAMLKFKGSEGSEFAGRTLGTLRARTMLLLLWWISQMPLASAQKPVGYRIFPQWEKFTACSRKQSTTGVSVASISVSVVAKQAAISYTGRDRLLEPRTPTYFSVCLAGDGASPGAFYLSPEDEGSDLRCGDAHIAVERGSDTRVF